MSWRPALMVLLVALALLGGNIAAAFAPLGQWHAAVSLSICMLETLVLALWWMHLRHAGALLRLCAAIPCAAFLLLLGLTLADLVTRRPLMPPW